MNAAQANKAGKLRHDKAERMVSVKIVLEKGVSQSMLDTYNIIISRHILALFRIKLINQQNDKIFVKFEAFMGLDLWEACEDISME